MVIKSDVRYARWFQFVHLIDGLATLFSFAEIYPLELVLQKKNSSKNEGSFFDLSIQIENNKFFMQLYDNRDTFLPLK